MVTTTTRGWRYDPNYFGRMISPIKIYVKLALTLHLLYSFSLGDIFTIEQVATGLRQPVAITHAGDGSNRLFITLQDGEIVIFDGNNILPVPFLDIEQRVSSFQSEQGLLSVAFHPDYGNNGLFYVNYTNNSGDTVIARYRVTSDPNIADPNSADILLNISQPFGNHNGGQLQFGPDGYLYIGMGDGGDAGDPFDYGQNLNTLLGKMLRIDVDSGSPYAIPSDNPFVGVSGAQDEIWAYGLRNPWRFSFDRLTGDLFIADVGQNSWEWVNFQLASSTGGENYGWRLMEGSNCFNPTTNCNDGSLILPILEYSHGLGCSITGGYRYRGSMIPQLSGTYFYADYCSGRIWGATESSDNVWTTTELMDTDFAISAFGEDEFGELYFTHYASRGGGTIYRLEPDLENFPPVITAQPVSQEIQSDTSVVLMVTASGNDLTFQWYFGNSGDTSNLIAGETNSTLNTGPLAASINYWVQVSNPNGTADSDTAIITVTVPPVPLVLDGSGDIAGENIQHPNGNIFDQVLLTGESIQLQARPNQITRVSFMDESEDIVQVEFSGTGAFTVTLDPATFLPPALPPRYNQQVEYVTGTPSLVIEGADSSTFFSIFTVGSINAVNQALFPEGQVYDAQADVTFVEVINSTGIGGMQLSNTVFSGSTGRVGVNARGVPIAVRLTIGDIDASGDAVPYLLFGEGSFTTPAKQSRVEDNGWRLGTDKRSFNLSR